MNNNAECKLCCAKNWQLIDTVQTGIWKKDNNQLSRVSIDFPVGLCQVCGHVQVTIEYTAEIFDVLYFSNASAPDMWCARADNSSPYQDMLDHIGFNLLAEVRSVADFGCGAGITLDLLKRYHPEVSCHGFDFQVQNCSTHIHANRCDLNKLDQTEYKKWWNSFDLVFSTHVLEHVIDPIEYLKNLARFSKPQGHLFIEVPDCSDAALACQLEYTNLVHGQHIHYYTADSLQHVAASAGWSFVRARHLRTDEIPRLQMLFKCEGEQLNSTGFDCSALPAVRFRFQRYNTRMSKLFGWIEQQVSSKVQVGLWGIGGDFHKLTCSFPIVKTWIEMKAIKLFDYELAGCEVFTQVIQSSLNIDKFPGLVFRLPFYEPTQRRMTLMASNFGYSNTIGHDEIN